MAYPFIRLPKFDAFRSRLENEFGCQYKTENHGTPFPINYFEREISGKTIKCVVNFESDQENLTPSVLRSVCARLDIDPKHFGLNIG